MTEVEAKQESSAPGGASGQNQRRRRGGGEKTCYNCGAVRSYSWHIQSVMPSLVDNSKHSIRPSFVFCIINYYRYCSSFGLSRHVVGSHCQGLCQSTSGRRCKAGDQQGSCPVSALLQLWQIGSHLCGLHQTSWKQGLLQLRQRWSHCQGLHGS